MSRSIMKPWGWPVLLAAAVAAACIFGAAWAGDRGDAAKLRQIKEMYQGYKRYFPEVPDISVPEAMRLQKSGRAVFVDQREPEEQRVSMLPGAVTASQVQRHPERYKGRILIAYCTISYRSGLLARELRKKGLQVYNLRGGILAWVHQGGKVYDPQGRRVRRIHVYGRRWNLAPAGYQAVW